LALFSIHDVTASGGGSGLHAGGQQPLNHDDLSVNLPAVRRITDVDC